MNSGVMFRVTRCFACLWNAYSHFVVCLVSVECVATFKSLTPDIATFVSFIARDAFVRMNRRAIAVTFVRLSVCLSGTGVHCDHTVHSIADLSLWLDSKCSGHVDTKTYPPTPNRVFFSSAWNGGGYGCAIKR